MPRQSPPAAGDKEAPGSPHGDVVTPRGRTGSTAAQSVDKTPTGGDTAARRETVGNGIPRGGRGHGARSLCR
jgi:hypothetical protein